MTGLIRRWKIPLTIALGLMLLALLLVSGAGLYYSESFKSGALEVKHEPDKLDLEIVAVGEDRVTLRATSDAADGGDWITDGLFGLQSASSYSQVGAIVAHNGREVTRELFPMSGTLQVGDRARLDSFAFPGDPLQALNIPFEERTVTGPLGELPAWLIRGSDDTWALFVHGKGASRREALRMLPAVHEVGLTAFVISYRNDEDAPQSGEGFYRYGQTEWEDLQAAARYALDSGARRLVLVGYSMGGAIAVSFLYQSGLA